jgi:hypothetical protein
MANHRGIRLQPFEKYSEKYEGYLFNTSTNIYRKPFTWVNKQGKTRQANRRFIEKKCCVCGVDMLQDLSNSKKHINGSCSETCTKTLRSNPDGFKKSKHGTDDSYTLVKCPDHPFRSKTGYVPEHRLLIEKQIGRFLTVDEHVHHINLIKSDNRIENLLLCESASQHFKAHGTLNKCVSQLLEIGALRFNHETFSYEVV